MLGSSQGRNRFQRNGRGAFRFALVAGAVFLLASGAALSAPPQWVSSRILNEKTVPYRMGDSLRIETIWRSPGEPITVLTADFKLHVVTDTTGAGPRYVRKSDSLWVVDYRIPYSKLRSDTSDAERGVKHLPHPKPIPITAVNASGAAVDSSIAILLDTVPPNQDSLTVNPLPRVTTRDSLRVSGTAPLHCKVVLLAGAQQHSIDPDPVTGLWSVKFPLPMGTMRIQARAEDEAGNSTPPVPSPPAAVTRVTANTRTPVLLRAAFRDTFPGGAPLPLHNRTAGDSASTVRLLTEWAVPDSIEMSDHLEIAADFSGLYGSVTPEPIEVLRDTTRHGTYLIVHTLPDQATRPDGTHILIPLTALAPNGRVTNDNSVFVCLSNEPPVHLGSRVVDEARAEHRRGTPYRTGDTLTIVTRWRVAPGLRLSASADFSRFQRGDSARTSPWGADTTSNDSVRIVHMFPLNPDDVTPGTHLPVTISGHDDGCGLTVSEPLFIDFDSTPPDSSSFLLDALPGVVDSAWVDISGSVADTSATRVQIMRDLTAKADTALVPHVPGDRTPRRFRARIPLLVGENKIQIRAEDASGNKSAFYPPLPVIVARVAGAGLRVLSASSRHDKENELRDDIVLRDPNGFTSATIRIFNLEGDCVMEYREPGPRSEFSVHWTGTDRNGLRAPQGYYLVRAEWKNSRGQVRSGATGLLLKD